MTQSLSLLERPTVFFWQTFSQSSTSTDRSATIVSIARRVLAFLGAVVTFPLYLAGRILRPLFKGFFSTVDRTISLASPSPEPIVFNPKTKPLTIETTTKPYPTTEEARKALAQLEALQAMPTWENFQKLPYQQQYLVAGRHTYPRSGWTSTRAIDLMILFEKEFRHQGSLSEASRGIAEAIYHQRAFVCLARLKDILTPSTDKKKALEELEAEDVSIYRCVLSLIGNNLHPSGDTDLVDFTRNQLLTEELSQDILRSLCIVVGTLKGAYLTIPREASTTSMTASSIPPPLVRTCLASYSTIEDTTRALAQLEEFHANPTWENFQKLPYQQQYLIAGRHTYPRSGWCAIPALELMILFETEFREKGSLSKTDKATTEAISYQRAFICIAHLKEILTNTEGRKEALERLENQDSATYKIVLDHLRRSYSYKIGLEAPFEESLLLTETLLNEKLTQAFDTIIHYFEGAYSL